MKCRHCNGDQEFYLLQKGDMGLEWPMFDPCRHCDGTGEEPCKRCNGAGVDLDHINKVAKIYGKCKEYPVCPRCKGTCKEPEKETA